jgi:hypothetical protein
MKNEISNKALIFFRAAELVEQYGICKFSYGSNGGARCARGHLMDASLELFGNQTEFHKYDDNNTFSLMAFNDRPETTAAMVAAKLRENAFKEPT